MRRWPAGLARLAARQPLGVIGAIIVLLIYRAVGRRRAGVR